MMNNSKSPMDQLTRNIDRTIQQVQQTAIKQQQGKCHNKVTTSAIHLNSRPVFSYSFSMVQQLFAKRAAVNSTTNSNEKPADSEATATICHWNWSLASS
jgi:hypothetical protein